MGLLERPPTSDGGLFAFYRQFWQPLRAPHCVSKSPSRQVARHLRRQPASVFRADLARNSRLSLRLASSGLTTVASAPPVADDMVPSGKRPQPAGARRAVYSTRLPRKAYADKFVIVAERHLNHINRKWRLHYNPERPYEARSHLPPGMETPPTANETVRLNDFVYSSRLGGLLNSYSRRAA